MADRLAAPFVTPHCCECSRLAKVLLRCAPDPASWCYAECDRCGDWLCGHHFDPDDEGRALCDGCYQHEALKRYR